MKGLWFSVLNFATAIFITIFSLIMLFLDEDTFIRAALLSSVLGTSLILVLIGAANLPKKEETK